MRNKHLLKPPRLLNSHGIRKDERKRELSNAESMQRWKGQEKGKEISNSGSFLPYSASKNLLHPSLCNSNVPWTSPSTRTNFSHLAWGSSPAEIRMTESSSVHPRHPLPPPSNVAWAKLHSEEKYFGNRGIFERKPHFLLSPYAVVVEELLPFSDADASLVVGRGAREGRSKMWMVDLSDVTARRRELGDMARENTVAWSRPRRSSAIMEEVAVEYTRIRVPYEPGFC